MDRKVDGGLTKWQWIEYVSYNLPNSDNEGFHSSRNTRCSISTTGPWESSFHPNERIVRYTILARHCHVFRKIPVLILYLQLPYGSPSFQIPVRPLKRLHVRMPVHRSCHRYDAGDTGDPPMGDPPGDGSLTELIWENALSSPVAGRAPRRWSREG